jgi:beta-glucosidase
VSPALSTNIHVSRHSPHRGEDLEVEVTVTKNGKYDGEEVVQLYLTHLGSGLDAPLYSLKGFKRIALEKGTSRKVRFRISPDQLGLVGQGRKMTWPRTR